MKKMISAILSVVLITAAFVGCASGGTDSSKPESSKMESSAAEESNKPDSSKVESSAAAESSKQESSQAAGMTGAITVVSREDGSGTRGAFIELMGVEQKNEAGEKIDRTADTAEITNSTSVMMTTVAGNKFAIGYISLGSLNASVKAVKIGGTEASAENVKNGTYPVARPFNIVTMEDTSELTQDFIAFIMSEEGQKVVEDSGYISQGNNGAYAGSKPAGKISVAGSSSITPVMEKLKEAYTTLNPEATIEIQQSDSTTGINSTVEGICDIGMASRELKDSEIEKGVKNTVIAMDGIAVIVNQENPVDQLTAEQVMKIYTGETANWEDVQ